MRKQLILRVLGYVVVAALAALVVVLARDYRDLGEQYRDLRRQMTEARRGIFVPTTALAALDGRTVQLGAPAARNQLLLFFNHSCPYCRASIPAWKHIAQTLGERVEIVGVALDSPQVAQAYATEHALPFPVVSAPEPRLKLVRLYRVSGIPMAIAVDGDGRVVYARSGVLNSPVAIDSVIHGALDRIPKPGTAPTRTTDPT